MHVHDCCPLCHSASIAAHGRAIPRFVPGEAFTLLRCADCDFVFTDPLPNTQEMTAYYGPAYAPHTSRPSMFAERVASFVRRFALPRRVRYIERHAPLAKARILDLGCGTGSLAAALRDRGHAVTAIEPSSQARAVGLARHRLRMLDLGALDSLPDASFDIVVLWHALEHMPDIHAAAQAIRRLLAPEGKAIIALPNYRSLDARWYGQHWAGYDAPLHASHFTPETLLRLLNQHGLRIVSLKKQHMMAPLLGLLSGGSALAALGVGIASELRALADPQASSCIVYVAARR